MEPLIRLQHLASQLSHSQSNKFISGLSHFYNGTQMAHILFSYYLDMYTHTKKYPTTLLNITESLQNIIDKSQQQGLDEIESTPSLQEVFDSKQPTTLHMLQTDLIGECASYLPLDDYINLGNTDRKIYLVTHAISSSSLQAITRHSFNDQSNFNDFVSISPVSIFCSPEALTPYSLYNKFSSCPFKKSSPVSIATYP